VLVSILEYISSIEVETGVLDNAFLYKQILNKAKRISITHKYNFQIANNNQGLVS